MTLSMEWIAEMIRNADEPAIVEMTGGGVATIYAGRGVSVLAGPGHFAGPNFTVPEAESENFCIGYDGEQPMATLSGNVTETMVAEIILTWIRHNPYRQGVGMKRFTATEVMVALAVTHADPGWEFAENLGIRVEWYDGFLAGFEGSASQACEYGDDETYRAGYESGHAAARARVEKPDEICRRCGWNHERQRDEGCLPLTPCVDEYFDERA